MTARARGAGAPAQARGQAQPLKPGDKHAAQGRAPNRLESWPTMPGYGAAFGRGLVLGVGAALLYAAARENAATDREPGQQQRVPHGQGGERLIDWDWATRV